MGYILPVLFVLAMLGVLGALAMGVFNMAKGGNPRRSNKLMQSRVLLQGLALLLFALFMMLYRHHAMVSLTRIYTRGGDGGETSLGDGSRVPKHALRVEAYGTVDEANAVDRPRPAVTRRARAPTRCWRASRTISSTSAPISATPGDRRARRQGALRIVAGAGRAAGARDRRDECRARAARLLRPAGRHAPAPPISISRGPSSRRAERLVAALAAPEPINPEALKYLNRLSDHLFVLGRHRQRRGRPRRAVAAGRQPLMRAARDRVQEMLAFGCARAQSARCAATSARSEPRPQR